MKKIYIACIVLFVLALTTQKSFGQDDASTKQKDNNGKKNVWWFAFKGGLSIPKLSAPASSGEYSKGYESILGPNIAISAEQRISKHLAIEYMIGYAAQGGQKHSGNIALSVAQVIPNFSSLAPGGLTQDQINAILNYNNLTPTSPLYVNLNGATSNLDYIQIPILVKYYATLSKRMNFYVDAGPFAGILLSAHQILKRPQFTPTNPQGSVDIYLNSNGASGGYLTIPASVMQQITGSPNAQDYPVKGLNGQPFDQNYNFYNQAHIGNIGVEGNIGFSYDLTPSQRIVVEGGGNYGFIRVQKDPANGTDKIGAGTVRVGYAVKF